MCGGGSDRAARQAAAAEAERKAEIARGTDLIDQAFAARQHYTADAERQKEIADRQLRFSMARGGLTGGSAQADANTELGREFSEGLLSAERQAQVGLADLMSRDDASRMNLLALVQSGANATTAAQQAGAAMRSNIQNAKSTGMVEGLGDVFGGTANLYKQQQEAAARRRGLKEAEIYANPFMRGDG